ncbi:MAG: GNAT family N-acetyltransferase [Desulfurococcaceae archaeon]
MAGSFDLVIRHTTQVIYTQLPGNVKAYLKYKVEDNVMKLIETYTPEEFRGKGIGYKLVEYAINLARVNNWLIEPICSFTIYYFMKNKDKRSILIDRYRELDDPDWFKLLEKAKRRESKSDIA